MSTRSLLNGLALGAGLMYILDPQAGPGRRRKVKERATAAVGSARSAVDRTADRTGRLARAAQEKIKDGAGRSRPEADDEPADRRKRGVLSHRSARIAAGAAGGTLAYLAIRKRGPLGGGLGAAGLGLVTMGLRGRIGRNGRNVHLEASTHVDAPVEKVFEFWSRYENFPRFLERVQEVRDLGNGRTRWTATGPGGMSLEWSALETGKVDNERLGWRSLPDSNVQSMGTVHFGRVGRGTDVRVEMAYAPPAGKVGHVIARFLGRDPRRMIEESLERIKPLLESGHSETQAPSSGASSRASQEP